MAGFKIERRIAAAPEAVFGRLRDLASLPSLMPGLLRVEVLTNGPTEVGTRFRATRRVMGREASQELEVSAFEPPGGLVLRAEAGGVEALAAVMLEPEDDGRATRLGVDVRLKPRSMLARLAVGLVEGVARPLVEGDLDDLKAAIEGA